MNAQRRRLVCIVVVVIGLCYVAVVVGHAQTQARPGSNTPGARSQAGAQANSNAAREQIWNSPNMLRARAWLQDYCSKSAQVTPEMAKRYQQELANMSATQLQLWLLKFDHDEQQRQQQYSLWQQAHTTALSQATAANKATQQSYADINREESEAAGVEQQKLNEQQEFAQSEQENKQLGTIGPYGPYGYGGTHYHFHLYPYPY